MEPAAKRKASMDDIHIISGLKRGSEAALDALAAQYALYIAAIIRNVGRGYFAAEDVEELAADVLAAVWNNSATIHGQALKPYLAQIARNKAISRLRRHKADTVSFDDDLLVPAHADGAPDAAAIEREQRELLNAAVDSMGVPDREIFIRFYYYGERIEDIAGMLHMQPSTVKSRLRRGRNKLRDSFMERGYRHEE